MYSKNLQVARQRLEEEEQRYDEDASEELCGNSSLEYSSENLPPLHSLHPYQLDQALRISGPSGLVFD